MGGNSLPLASASHSDNRHGFPPLYALALGYFILLIFGRSFISILSEDKSYTAHLQSNLAPQLRGSLSSSSSSSSLSSSSKSVNELEAPWNSASFHDSSSYPGGRWRTNQTIEATELLVNPWMRVESHTVRDEKGKLHQEWIWMDVIDQVNVLVHHKKKDQFIVFKQRKYGLEGLTLAPVGGHVDMRNGESPLSCAQRELLEELGLLSDSWHFLGTYRVNANRGHGMVSLFFAESCYKSSSSLSSSASSTSDESENGELEHLEAEWMSRQDLLSALLKGKFQEVKWTATIAMALLATDERFQGKYALPDERQQQSEKKPHEFDKKWLKNNPGQRRPPHHDQLSGKRSKDSSQVLSEKQDSASE